ncbi:MAG TPA: hypothetical protein ENJ05_06385 [Thiotrichales bacterium]|nr:hypothetical protein [Thiotrichales bacterium]
MMVEGRVSAKNPAEFKRFVDLLGLAKFGDRLVANSQAACELAVKYLTDEARRNVLIESARGRQPSCNIHIGNGMYKKYYWRGETELDWQDSEARFRKEYLPQIMKAAKKVAGMDKLREAIFFLDTRVGQGKYSREEQAFTLEPVRLYQLNGDLVWARGVKYIEKWPVPEARARALMKEFFAPRPNAPPHRYAKLRLVVSAHLDDAFQGQGYIGVLATVRDVRLFRRSDTGLADMLHRFDPSDYTDYEALARAEKERQRAEKERKIASMPRVSFVDGAYLMAAYAQLSGTGKKLVDERLERVNWGSNPFEAKRARESAKQRLLKALENASRRFRRDEPVWVKGELRFKVYNLDEGYFPLDKIELTVDMGDISEVSMELAQDQIARLPVPARIAEGLARTNQAVFRALVRPVDTKVYSDKDRRTGKERPFGHTVIMGIDKLELLKNGRYVDYQYEENRLWAYTPPSYASIEQRKDELSEECEASGSSACYQKLCARIKATATKEEYKACRKKQAAALAKEKRAQFNAAAGAAAASLGAGQGAPGKTAVRTNSRSDCGRKYGGYQAQAWIPVSGTPEHKAAIEHCLKQPVREPYGRDILGLRLGMASNDANRLMQRQPYERNVLAEDSRPFEKGQLAISRDRNDGLAAFFLGNGNVDRVAAVSRRVYFKEGQMQAAKLQQGLRKKYGKESWSRGEAMMWLDSSAKASPSSCSGLVSMIEERGGWRAGGWVLKGRSRANRGNASMAIGMQAGMRAGAIQQECMAKYGMPSGGADMRAQIQKLQRCMEEKMAAAGAAAGATADAVMADSSDQERRPHTVKMTAKPAQYAKYKACGPVVIALFNKGAGGSVKDLSLVLFDPEWVSRQPEFAFKQEGDAGLRF